MTIDQLQAAMKERPFKPFNVCLGDGRVLPITHPENIAMGHGATRTFVVYGPGDAYRVVDLLLVTTLDFANGHAEQKKS